MRFDSIGPSFIWCFINFIPDVYIESLYYKYDNNFLRFLSTVPNGVLRMGHRKCKGDEPPNNILPCPTRPEPFILSPISRVLTNVWPPFILHQFGHNSVVWKGSKKNEARQQNVMGAHIFSAMETFYCSLSLQPFRWDPKGRLYLGGRTKDWAPGPNAGGSAMLHCHIDKPRAGCRSLSLFLALWRFGGPLFSSNWCCCCFCLGLWFCFLL